MLLKHHLHRIEHKECRAEGHPRGKKTTVSGRGPQPHKDRKIPPHQKSVKMAKPHAINKGHPEIPLRKNSVPPPKKISIPTSVLDKRPLKPIEAPHVRREDKDVMNWSDCTTMLYPGPMFRSEISTEPMKEETPVTNDATLSEIKEILSIHIKVPMTITFNGITINLELPSLEVYSDEMHAEEAAKLVMTVLRNLSTILASSTKDHPYNNLKEASEQNAALDNGEDSKQQPLG